MGAFSLIVLIFTAIIFCVATISIAQFFVKKTENSQKGLPYECGIPSDGSPWAAQFSVGYYLFALIFLIFDVELIFMYPWAVVVMRVGMMALFEIIVFMFILFMGFLYAHKKGALKWM